jgi:hypothetical protein
MAHMPLVDAADDLANKARKSGTPRSEREQEVMTDRAKDRAVGIGRSKQNDLFHGHPTDSRASVGKGRVGKYGLTV